MREGRSWIVVAAVAGLLAACGDMETTDNRGYTKAPLERPGLRITSEEPTEMDRLGDPIRPRPSDGAPGESAEDEQE